MTKKEAQDSLRNTKVYVNGKSKNIQEKLFEIGVQWSTGSSIVKYTERPFLYIDHDLKMTHELDMEYFNNSPLMEITADYILNIQINEIPQFKPFDKILYKYKQHDFWKAGIYSHFRNNKHFIIGYGFMKDINIIPYDGNEDKLDKVTD